jgi:hypothetical protein
MAANTFHFFFLCGCKEKKQRNTLQKAIAPQLFAGYTLLTQSTMRRHSAGFYAEREGVGQLLCYLSS